MCRMKSMILLKDSVFCPDYDSHSDMLDVLKIKDNKRIPDFVKIEIVPPQDDMSRPVEEWAYEPDQDKFPEWYVREVDEPRCREALKKWAAEHIFTDGNHEVHNGTYYACGSSTVTAWDSSTVKELHDRAVAIKRESYFSKPVVEIAGEDTLRGPQKGKE